MEKNHMPAPSGQEKQSPPTAARRPQLLMGPPPPTASSTTTPPSYFQSQMGLAHAATSELPPIQTSHDEAAEQQALPPLSTLTAQAAIPPPVAAADRIAQPWPSLNPLSAYHTAQQQADSPARMDVVDVSSSSAMSTASPRASSVSLDDPDVRLAAEALGDLRADFSPPKQSTTSLPIPSPPRDSLPAHPEPLLSLLTTSHPLLATTIEGATSAYNSSKNYSPRFKSGAEYVEGYLTPLANTVGSVGRVTGVEGGVRWFLGGSRRQSADAEPEGSNKRRRLDARSASLSAAEAMRDDLPPPRAGDADSEMQKLERRLSMASTIDTLPAYDEQRSPAYTETADGQARRASLPPNPAWQSRLITSTSGLSVAMSEESLRSLKYCLTWLRWANDRIGGIIGTLKTTLDRYDAAETRANQEEPDVEAMAVDGAEDSASSLDQPDSTQLEAQVNILRGEVLRTLKDVIDTVSRYAGGALPENARILVRKHLTSLPQRFRLASMAESGAAGPSGAGGAERDAKAVREGAQRVLVLAKEGLDMVSQVGGVLDATIVTAEEWCDRLGRRVSGSRQPLLPQTEPTIKEEEKTD